jgi:hypothetical protein
VLTFFPAEQSFVVPRATLLDQLESDPTETAQSTDDAVETAARFLDKRPAGTASVLYLTADAGEGKTTVITELARKQAEQYKRKETDWLLVPISLGGRPFLRFDDVIVAALVNRLRFPFLYYDSFIELVRMGVLVPALDGFEEMFIESSTGEAVSALGNLMQAMQSSGSVLIAARKAYFDYKRLETQAKLFDTLGDQSVAFSRLALQRWNRANFLEYGTKRKVLVATQLYDSMAERLGQVDHPLLTRAVMVKRLLDVAAETPDINDLLSHFSGAPTNYFSFFVRAIITREAEKNWIDKSGEPARPLISEEEHQGLLGLLAQEMWTSGTEVLREDLLDVTAELFCDTHSKSAAIRRQVIERLKQHALIARQQGSSGGFSFDHVEFYHYFLGHAVGQALLMTSQLDIRQMLRRGLLPTFSVEVASSQLRDSLAVVKTAELFSSLAEHESVSSFLAENCGGIIVRALGATAARKVTIRNLTMPVDSLANQVIQDNLFVKCYFQSTLLREGSTAGVRFEACQFELLELLDPRALRDTVFMDCRFRAVTPPGNDVPIFGPEQVSAILRNAGAELLFREIESVEDEPIAEPDKALDVTRRVLRAFIRATELNENTLRQKLGIHASYMSSDVLPQLLDVGVLRTVAYRGAGVQRRFKLDVPLRTINEALERCQGRFEVFIDNVRRQ